MKGLPAIVFAPLPQINDRIGLFLCVLVIRARHYMPGQPARCRCAMRLSAVIQAWLSFRQGM